MTAIPELVEACALHNRLEHERLEADQVLSDSPEAKLRRSLWLAALAKGTTRAQIRNQCGVDARTLEAELTRARIEAGEDDPTAKRGQRGGLTLGIYWCPEDDCPHAENDGNEPFASAQALSMHRVKAHDYRIGEKALTASMVKRARASEEPTRTLARRWRVSHYALGAARAGRTWRDI